MAVKTGIVIPDMHGGGAERAASLLSLHLPGEKFIIVSRLTVDYPHGGTLINLDVPPSGNYLVSALSLIRRVNRLRSLKKRLSLSVAVSFLEPANFANILSRRGEKVIVSVREFKSVSDSNRGLPGFVSRILMKRLYNSAHSVVAVSQSVKRDLIENFSLDPDRVKVIPNMFDLGAIHAASREQIPPEHEGIFSSPVIITCGRLSKEKGQWHLIDVLKKVRESIPSAKLVFLGDGELKEFLCAYARRSGLGVGQDIFFLGFQKNPFKFIARAAVFALPSFWEGFPNSLVEAMATGTPVAASDCDGGSREILAPSSDPHVRTGRADFVEYGALLPVFPGWKPGMAGGDCVAVWAEALVRLISDEQSSRLYREQGMRRARDFSIEKVLPEWLTLLTDGQELR
ncbi:MAG: glycosyltransferase [Deltaproteobacteria bacterium]